MATELQKVVPAKRRPDDKVVALCRDLLAKAEAGELQAIGAAYITFDEEGECANWQAQIGRRIQRTMVIGAIELLKTEILDRVLE